MPKPLVSLALAPFLVTHGLLGAKSLDALRRTEAEDALARVFNVNRAVARIRLAESYPQESEKQLTL